MKLLSILVALIHGGRAFEFDAGIVGCELPIGPGVMVVAMIFQASTSLWRACLLGMRRRRHCVSQNGEFGIRPCRANFHAWACNAIRTALLVGGPRARERPRRAKPPCAC